MCPSGWKRNCCKHCDADYYLAEQPEGRASSSGSPEGSASSSGQAENESRWRRTSQCKPVTCEYCPVSKQDLEMQFDGAKAWLQKHVPAKFWEMCEDMWVEQNLKYRAEAKNINEHIGLSSRKPLLKLVSYWGAVGVPKWATKWTCPEYPGFADVGNLTYASTFRGVWPDCRLADRAAYNDCTVGDHLEAFLGWHIYWVQVHQAEFPEQCRDVITCLEQALFTAWALYWLY